MKKQKKNKKLTDKELEETHSVILRLRNFSEITRRVFNVIITEKKHARSFEEYNEAGNNLLKLAIQSDSFTDHDKYEEILNEMNNSFKMAAKAANTSSELRKAGDNYSLLLGCDFISDDSIKIGIKKMLDLYRKSMDKSNKFEDYYLLSMSYLSASKLFSGNIFSVIQRSECIKSMQYLLKKSIKLTKNDYQKESIKDRLLGMSKYNNFTKEEKVIWKRMALGIKVNIPVDKEKDKEKAIKLDLTINEKDVLDNKESAEELSVSKKEEEKVARQRIDFLETNEKSESLKKNDQTEVKEDSTLAKTKKVSKFKNIFKKQSANKATKVKKVKKLKTPKIALFKFFKRKKDKVEKVEIQSSKEEKIQKISKAKKIIIFPRFIKFKRKIKEDLAVDFDASDTYKKQEIPELKNSQKNKKTTPSPSFFRKFTFSRKKSVVAQEASLDF